MEARDILVVDDSRMVRTMVREVLESQGSGYRVAEAENGRDALEQVARQRPDLLILDVMMPEVDGYEVCRVVREDPEYLPILMITTKDDVEDLARGLEAGADDYISKPFKNAELLARVKSLLRIRSLQKRLYAQNEELEAKNQQLQALFEQLGALNEELTLLSVTDGLTKAYNHRHFQERLRSEFARATRYGETLSCVMIDIDKFKAVNDTFGHPVGDRVLVRLVDMIHEEIRKEDLVARYGGEEFVLLLPETPGSRALVLAERLRQRVETERIPVPGHGDLSFRVSAGVAEFQPGQGDVQDPGALLNAADRALYRAKANGRNQVVVA